MKEEETDRNIFSKEQLHALSPKRIEVSKQLFSFVSEILNQIHDTDLSERFWKLMAEEYTRSIIIRHDIFRTAPMKYSPPFLPQLSSKPTDFKARLRSRLVNVRNYIRSRGDRKQLFEKLYTHDQLLVGFSGDSFVAKDTGAVPLPDCALKPGIWGDREKRKRLNQVADKEPDLFKKNVLRQMPGYLVEHFSSIYESIKLVQPENKTFHLHGKFRFSYRQIVLAKYAEFGSQLIWYQNGAMVGECKYKYGGYLVRSVADEHRTWGWKMNGVDRPWKAYDLEQFGKKYEQTKKECRDDLLITFPKLWDAEDYYLGITQELLQSLDEKIYKSIRIRPYPSWKSGSGAASFQKFSDSRVTISTFEESMAEEVANSRIVLHINVPATSFLESVSVDHPTTGLLMNEYPTDIVKPYYEDFLSRRMLHTEIASVTEHLNNAQIDEWWNTIMASETYEGYKKLFTGA